MKDNWKSKIWSVFVALIFTYCGISFLSQCVPHTSDQPVGQLIADVTKNGRDATCEDLLGEWKVLDTSLTLEFKPDKKFFGKAGRSIFIGAGSYGSYSCQQEQRGKTAVTIPYIGSGEDLPPDVTFYLEQIHNDTIITNWDLEKREVRRVMVKSE